MKINKLKNVLLKKSFFNFYFNNKFANVVLMYSNKKIFKLLNLYK